MSDVIGRGVIEVSADSSKLNAAISEARRKLSGLGDAGKTSAARNSASIDKYVKSLEAQNAVFGKSKREAELYRLALKGASDQQLRAANSALRLGEAHQRHERMMARIRVSFLAIATAAAAMAVAGVVAFDKLIKRAGDFQDMAEKTGDTAENLASLAVAAEVGGISMDEMADAIVKLNKQLLGVDDESKDAGAALKALGLNIAEIKAMKGADQLEAIGKALNGFAEGSGKSNVATALFSKSGKELLSTLKILGEEGGRQKILTQEQIEQADDYADKQAKLRAELKLHASQIATQMLPVLNDFLKYIVTLTKDQDFMAASTSGLKTILAGALGTFQALAVIGLDVAFSFRAISTELEGIKKTAAALQTLDFKEIARIGRETAAAISADFDRTQRLKEAVTRVDPFSIGSAGKTAPPAVSDADKKNLADLLETYKQAEKVYENLRKKKDPGANMAQLDVINAKGLYEQEARRIAALTPPPAPPAPGGTGNPNKPPLVFEPAKKGGSTQAQERKAQLDADLDLIRKSSDALLNTYSNAEKILDARRSANLINERDYYEAKAAFIRLDSDAQARALEDEIARLEQEKAVGKEKIDNEKKIADARSKLAKVREGEATQIELSNIEHQAGVNKITQSYIEAAAAAQTYIDTIKRQNAREVAGIGRGQKFRERQEGVNAIEDKLLDRKNELDTDLRREDITPEQYAVYLQIATDTYKKEVQAFDERTAAIQARQADGFNGMTEALQNYADTARDVAGMTEQAFGSALSGLEDALVEFATTGKASFKDLLASIQADIVRIGFRKMIGNAIDSFLPQLAGMFGGGGAMASGAGAAAGAAGAVAGAASEGAQAAAIAANTAAIAGQTASVTANAGATTAATAATGAMSAAQSAATAAIASASASSAAALGALTAAASAAASALATVAASSAADGASKVAGVIAAAGGGRAIGGPVSAGGLYQVNERGPELLSVAGKEYLMMGQHGGTVTPLAGGGKGGGDTYLNVTVAPPAGASRATAQQFGATAGRQMQIAMRRNG